MLGLVIVRILWIGIVHCLRASSIGIGLVVGIACPRLSKYKRELSACKSLFN